MTKQKNPYIPPKVEFHPAGSDAYNRFRALLDEEVNQVADFQKICPNDSSNESLLREKCVGE